MKKKSILFVIGILVCLLAACGKTADTKEKEHDTAISQKLTFDHSEELTYAQKFSIDDYEGDYHLVTVTDGSRYLLVPEGKEVPDDLASDIVVIQEPDSEYLSGQHLRQWICSSLWTHWIRSGSAV